MKRENREPRTIGEASKVSYTFNWNIRRKERAKMQNGRAEETSVVSYKPKHTFSYDLAIMLLVFIQMSCKLTSTQKPVHKYL